jgi:3-deoxy-D-manno-octulosonate 8-phosphate phosphatase KdsC-like HAD superfamily phosphatase
LDGNPFVKEKVDYVTDAKDGQGVLTELIDLIISCKFILKAKFLTNYEIK